MIRTVRVFSVVLLAVLCCAAGGPPAAEQSTSDTTPPSDMRAEQRAPADGSPEAAPDAARSAEQANKVADAISAGKVLIGMTMAQVLKARGEPARKEAIPPDAALWHYPEGEVAFSDGQVSYAAAEAPKPSVPSPGAGAAGSPTQPRPPASEPAALDTARVHTPGDGFLALRSEPSIRRGGRLDKIPHGSVLTLEECRTWPQDGRWCTTRFRGRSGWVFERYLVR